MYGGTGRYTHLATPAAAWIKNKATRLGCFIFCLKRDKRCLNKGKNEQKVSDSMTVQCDAQWDNMFPNLHLFLGIALQCKLICPIKQ